jgi:hypothetical protein
MTTLTTLEAYDLIKFSEQFHERIAGAQTALNQKRGLKPEKDWMTAAVELVVAAREPAKGLLERARGLPELDEVRGEYAADFQNDWVDALEKLMAGITFHVGSRDPVIEALFPHQKLPAMRRCSQEVATEFVKDFERRLKGAYLTRQLTQPAFAFVGPVLEQINAAWNRYLSAFGGGVQMPEDQAIEVRKDLVAAAKRIDLAVTQARLLAEAALVPVNGAFETAGLSLKPRKRKARIVDLPAGEAPERAEAGAEETPAAPAQPEVAAAPSPAAAPAEAAAPAAEKAAEPKVARPRKKKEEPPAEAKS